MGRRLIAGWLAAIASFAALASAGRLNFLDNVTGWVALVWLAYFLALVGLTLKRLMRL